MSTGRDPEHIPLRDLTTRQERAMDDNDYSGPRGLSDKQAGEALEALGYQHFRVRSALVEARQASSVTLGRHLVTLEDGGFRIELLAQPESEEPQRKNPVEDRLASLDDHVHPDSAPCGHEPEGREIALAPGSVDGDLAEPEQDEEPSEVTREEWEHEIPPEQDQAWRDMVALGQELQGEPLDEESRRDEAHAAAMEELARVFQYFIDANSHTSLEPRTERFTIDGAAFYRVTPEQWRELMHVAPDDIRALNDEPANVPPYPPAPPLGPVPPWPAPTPQQQAPIAPIAIQLTGSECVQRLQELGYGRGEAETAVAQVMTGTENFSSRWAGLRAHVIYWSGLDADVFAIYPAPQPQPYQDPIRPDPVTGELASQGMRHQAALNALIDIGCPSSEAADVLDKAATPGQGYHYHWRGWDVGYSGRTQLWTITRGREWPPGLHEIHCRDDRCSLGCDCPCHLGRPVPPLASGLTDEEAATKLMLLGYDIPIARAAIATAAETAGGFCRMERHVVEAEAPTGPFSIRTIITVLPYVPAPGYLAQGTQEMTITLSSPDVPDDPEMRDAARRAFEAATEETEALGRPLDREEAITALTVLGYTASEAAATIDASTRTGDGTIVARNHVVQWDGGDHWEIRPVDLLRYMNGHELSFEQISRHGADRYPTPARQWGKVLDELSELHAAMLDGDQDQVWREYADTGLALFALGDKLGLDLIGCMRDLVRGDTRDFREEQP